MLSWIMTLCVVQCGRDVLRRNFLLSPTQWKCLTGSEFGMLMSLRAVG